MTIPSARSKQNSAYQGEEKEVAWHSLFMGRSGTATTAFSDPFLFHGPLTAPFTTPFSAPFTYAFSDIGRPCEFEIQSNRLLPREKGTGVNTTLSIPR